MNEEGQRISGPHTIKLHNRSVQVQLEYHSPPKKDRKERRERKEEVCLKEITLVPAKRQKPEPDTQIKIHNLNSFKSVKRIKLANSSPFFYCKGIEEGNPIIAEYEAFHQRMLEVEPEPRKLKVYSNSKQLKHLPKKPPINTLVQANQPLITRLVPLRKIKLFSPPKGAQRDGIQLRQADDMKAEASQVKVVRLRGTPDRRQKLEVTSSKSRNKQDSLLSRQQRSIEVSKKVSGKAEEKTPDRFLKSFHSQSFHQR